MLEVLVLDFRYSTTCIERSSARTSDTRPTLQERTCIGRGMVCRPWFDSCRLKKYAKVENLNKSRSFTGQMMFNSPDMMSKSSEMMSK